MSATLTKTGKGGLDLGELALLRDALREQQRGAVRLLAQIEKMLNGAMPREVAHTAAANVTPARPSPLDRVKAVTAATADLREGNGNLSAVRVAKLYGVSLSQLAGWLGRTKQAVSKTPDAESLQEALGYFERVARLRMITKDDQGFRKWLRTPHPDIDAMNPLELMARREWQALADYVESILTGVPG